MGGVVVSLKNKASFLGRSKAKKERKHFWQWFLQIEFILKMQMGCCRFHFKKYLTHPWDFAFVRTLSILLNNPLYKSMINQGNRKNVHFFTDLYRSFPLKLLAGLLLWFLDTSPGMLLFTLKSTELYYISFV